MISHSYYRNGIILGWICLVLVTGCRSNSGRTVVKDGYLLQIQRPSVKLSLPRNIEIRKCRVAAAFGGRNLVYRISPVQYEIDRFHNLLVPMDQQLTEAMERWFRPQGKNASVDAFLGRIVVDVTLDELVGDFVNREEPQACVEIAFSVVRDEGRTREVILEKGYCASVKMPLNPTPGQVVTAMSRSVEQVLQEFETDLTKCLEATK